MTDDVNQSPSSPPEGSLHGDSSVHREDSEMDVSPLTKEVNVMTQDDLDKLKEKYSFPPRVQTRIPGKGETILSTRPSEVDFYEATFPTGLRFPIHPIIRRILNHYKNMSRPTLSQCMAMHRLRVGDMEILQAPHVL